MDNSLYSVTEIAVAHTLDIIILTHKSAIHILDSIALKQQHFLPWLIIACRSP